ncbi:hypothetical protein RvY_18555 [Ramazzottius varieornatus]|uniref:Uncharacterized protein n=1 Tax=Ramazzottius varieornatus TaxID=947166 RepID=A0A1D1W683_RAMVA|nr:hypothetical protein RvY_18555 [Ramazzottius varieornatus]
MHDFWQDQTVLADFLRGNYALATPKSVGKFWKCLSARTRPRALLSRFGLG